MSIAGFGKIPLVPSATSATQVPFGWDLIRVAIFIVHLMIVTYVSMGWLGSTRIGLLFYLLLLPIIVLQWLFNAGGSILNNAETLIRTGHWRDTRNTFEGHFFQNMLGAVGIRASTTLINFIVCITMLFFWFEAFFRMILIPTVH